MERLEDKTEKIHSLLKDGVELDSILSEQQDINHEDIASAAAAALTPFDRIMMTQIDSQSLVIKLVQSLSSWSDEEDRKLKDWRSQGLSIADISTRLNRFPSVVCERMKHLGLLT